MSLEMTQIMALYFYYSLWSLYIIVNYHIFDILILYFFLSDSMYLFFFFFFSSRRRHTRFDCDWSSDVCSSDLWEKEKFEKYDAKTMFDDLFVNGYDDMAILQPTYLTDFYKNGFNTTERNSALKKSHPDRFILNGAFDPRDGTKGLEDLHALSEKHKLKGIKLYTAEWRGESKGYKLTDKASYQYLEAAQKLGIKNIHVHKGPTIIPLNRDAFDVADIDDVATSFQDLNFIVEHCGLPRLDDFCWIATQGPNVCAGLSVSLPFIHTRPGYFAH